MKKFMFAAVAAAGIAAVSTGDSVTIDGVKWNYRVTNSSKGYVSLGGGTESTRAIASYAVVDAGSIPWTFPSGNGTYTVTGIKPYAFNSCTNLTGTLVIPEACKTIAGRAFKGCTGLSYIRGITNATTLGEYAFYQCRSLSNEGMDLSKSSIGAGVFSGCYGLTGEVRLREGMTTLPEGLLVGTAVTNVVIPTSVTTMKGKVLMNSTEIKALVIPGPISGSMNVVADQTFAGSKKLQVVMFGPNTRCVSQTLTNNNMLKDVSGCTLFVPKSGWDGVRVGGVGTKLVLYGPEEAVDIRIDTIGNTINATVRSNAALVTVTECAALFKTNCNYNTSISSEVVVDNTTSINPDLFDSAVVYKTPTQSQVDAVYSLLNGNVANVIFDMTEATENITMPGSTNDNITVKMKGGAKYITKKREFSIIIR